MKTDELFGFLKTKRLKGNGKNNTAINLIYGFDFFLKRRIPADHRLQHAAAICVVVVQII